MTITLHLTGDETAALQKYAQTRGVSMHEAAHEAIRQLVHSERRDTLSQVIRDRDRELMDRLAR